MLFIDLDNFKTINDSLGHAAGDHVLVETAHRVRSTLRAEDTAARLGGDEFAVLLEDADVTCAARVAERIRVALGTPFWVLGQEVFVSASIGIAMREEGDTAGDLLRNADVAMYTAKTEGQGPLRDLRGGDARRGRGPAGHGGRAAAGHRAPASSSSTTSRSSASRPARSSAPRRWSAGSTRRAAWCRRSSSSRSPRRPA